MKKKFLFTALFVSILMLLFSLTVLADEDNNDEVNNDNEEENDETAEEFFDEELNEEIEIAFPFQEYRYSGTSFWYIGLFTHEKDFRFIGGDAHFSVEGRGEARGNQHIHSVSQALSPEEYSHRVNIDTYLWGRTADDATAMDLKAAEDRALEQIKRERQEAVDALNARFRADDNMTAADYEAALQAIREEYEEKRLAIKREFDQVKNNVKLVSSVSVLEGTAHETHLTSGVNMDPGETGYIKQNVAANQDQDGEYLRLRNEVENTGGVTVNDLEVGEYLNESLRVEGYAKVRQSATVEAGGARTGWWNTGP